ncbi:MAG: hypothetical protein K6B65_06930 [Bacilli bacterium]|nr:hypothetical protein [Bacilli bacterium]
MKKKVLPSLILNLLCLSSVILGLIFMFCGINWDKGALVTAGFEAFQYFTVDSNVLMGVIAIIFLIYEVLLVMGKIEAIPKAIYIVKLTGTVGVALTFLTVVFYLAPTYMQYGYSYFSMFVNANLFLHGLAPLLAIIAWLIFEHTDLLRVKTAVLGIIPMAIYAVFYITNAFTHIDAQGKIPFKYDWYAFCQGGVGFGLLSLFVMLLITTGIALLLYLGNRRIDLFKDKE